MSTQLAVYFAAIYLIGTGRISKVDDAVILAKEVWLELQKNL